MGHLSKDKRTCLLTGFQYSLLSRKKKYSLLSGSTCHLTGLKYLFYAARYSLLTRPRLLQKLKLIFRKEGAAENVAGQQQQMIGGMEANGKFPSKKPPNKAVRETQKG